jgi:myo-inositol-1(or 4)-monophosphatase
MSDIAAQTRNAVLKAGEIIREQWSQPKDIRHKGRIDLVTQTDLQVEDLLKTELQVVLPEADFLAEESAQDLAPGRLTWVIDPLDGTTNFAHSIPQVAVSVALWQQNCIEMGWVYLPILGEMFQASRGQGAFCNDRPIRVSRQTDLEQALIATGFPYSVRERINEIMPAFSAALSQTRGLRRMGSAAVDLAYTACGRFDGFYELGLKPWDTAAGWLLVEEAGGSVTQMDPVETYCLGADSILASNGLIHEALAACIAP